MAAEIGHDLGGQQRRRSARPHIARSGTSAQVLAQAKIDCPERSTVRCRHRGVDRTIGGSDGHRADLARPVAAQQRRGATSTGARARALGDQPRCGPGCRCAPHAIDSTPGQHEGLQRGSDTPPARTPSPRHPSFRFLDLDDVSLRPTHHSRTRTRRMLVGANPETDSSCARLVKVAGQRADTVFRSGSPHPTRLDARPAALRRNRPSVTRRQARDVDDVRR